jgi:hypothetical protein
MVLAKTIIDRTAQNIPKYINGRGGKQLQAR